MEKYYVGMFEVISPFVLGNQIRREQYLVICKYVFWYESDGIFEIYNEDWPMLRITPYGLQSCNH